MVELCQQPTAGNDGMGLEKFEGSRGRHLTGNDAGKVLFNRQQIDGTDFSVHRKETKCAPEGLCLLPFPMEVDANGDVKQREAAHFLLRRNKSKLTVCLAPPNKADGGGRNCLNSLRQSNVWLMLNSIVSVEREVNLLGYHNSNTNNGLVHRIFLIFSMKASAESKVQAHS